MSEYGVSVRFWLCVGRLVGVHHDWLLEGEQCYYAEAHNNSCHNFIHIRALASRLTQIHATLQ